MTAAWYLKVQRVRVHFGAHIARVVYIVDDEHLVAGAASRGRGTTTSQWALVCAWLCGRPPAGRQTIVAIVRQVHNAVIVRHNDRLSEALQVSQFCVGPNKMCFTCKSVPVA